MDVSLSSYIGSDTALWFIGLWLFMGGFIATKKDFVKMTYSAAEVRYRHYYHNRGIEAISHDSIQSATRRIVKSFYSRINIGGMMCSTIPWLYMHSYLFYVIPTFYVVLICNNWFEATGNRHTTKLKVGFFVSLVGFISMVMSSLISLNVIEGY